MSLLLILHCMILVSLLFWFVYRPIINYFKSKYFIIKANNSCLEKCEQCVMLFKNSSKPDRIQWNHKFNTKRQCQEILLFMRKHKYTQDLGNLRPALGAGPTGPIGDQVNVCPGLWLWVSVIALVSVLLLSMFIRG